MKEIKTTVYNINELSKNAREIAIKDHRENMGFNPSFVFDKWKDILSEMGFTDIKIYYRGFSSQGDGAMFQANLNIACMPSPDNFKVVLESYPDFKDLEYYVKELWNIKNTKGLYSIVIKHQGHYYHHNSKTIEYNPEENNSPIDYDKLEKDFNAFYVNLCHDIYKELNEDYSHQMSDEYIIELMENNNYHFYQNGEFYSE